MNKTDWDLVRKIFNASIDLCEKIEELELHTEEARHKADEDGLTTWECLTSSWTYPETLANDIIRLRHKLEADNNYVDAISRTLIKIGNLTAQTVNAKDVLDKEVSGMDGEVTTLRANIEKYVSWCDEFMPKKLEELK